MTALSAQTAALRDGLHSGLTRLQLDCNAQQHEQLLRFADLLLRWNGTYNLTAIRNPADLLSHHLLDCLAVLPHLEAAPTTVLDVGSGGGLPGVVWAVMRPQWQVSCVDAVSKKMAFVQQAAGALGLTNLQATHTRLDAKRPAANLAQHHFDLVTSRAFSSLTDFTTLTRFHVKQTGRWLAMKGKPPSEELGALPVFAQHLRTQQINVPGLNEARCLVWLQPSAA